MYNPVAYMFNADIYCIDCIREMFFDPKVMGEYDDVETVLDKAARTRGIADRYDETAYDSSVFPKSCPHNDSDVRQASCGRCLQRIESTI